jgi:hypothetical protein
MTSRSWVICSSVLILVLVPCFWLPQIQSSDLASHLYNAWLTTLVEKGELDGLYLAPQITNILFDWLLAKLLPAVGKVAAGRIAVVLCVAILFTGGIALFYAVTRRIPWHVVGSLAMLCYGFVFHMGLFNFYFSLGCCIWSLALIWRRPISQWWLAIPLVAIAFLGHPFPVLWLLAVAGIIAIARRLAPSGRFWLLIGGVFAILAIRLGVQLTLTSSWEPRQLLLFSGADQALVYDIRYVWIELAWAAWWGYLLWALIARDGWATVSSSLPFILACLNGLGIMLIPTQILPPGYTAAFGMIAERMSLPQGILVALLLAHLPSSNFRVVVQTVLTCVFFAVIYQSESRLTALESSVERAVAQLPSGSRVLSGLCWPRTRLNGAYHLVDRACIGHCFSYGNFEPASGQFRLHAEPGNQFAVAEIKRADAYEFEEIVYGAEDLATFRIEGNLGSEPRIRKLEAGARLLPPCPSSAKRP